MAFIQTGITAEAVIQAMYEDRGFAFDMWRQIADGLHKGLLLDDAIDLLRAAPIEDCVFITQQLQMIPQFLAEHIEYETSDE